MPTNSAEWYALGTAIAFSIINAVISYVNRQHLQTLASVPLDIATLKVQTNHLASTLINTTGAASFQAGVTAALLNPTQAAATAAAAAAPAVIAPIPPPELPKAPPPKA